MHQNNTTDPIARHAQQALLTLKAWLHDARKEDRGDVPGWVMITLMSAMLVAGLMLIAGPALTDLFQSAINQVSP